MEPKAAIFLFLWLLQLVHQDNRFGDFFHGAAGVHAFLVDQAVGSFYVI
jgi:hypothetical protein